MTRKIEVNPESLTIFLQATHADLLTVNVALASRPYATVTANAIKVNRNRIERLRSVIYAISLSEVTTKLLTLGEGK